jgi:hypothetical protein
MVDGGIWLFNAANLNFSNPTDFGLKSAAVGDRF